MDPGAFRTEQVEGMAKGRVRCRIQLMSGQRAGRAECRQDLLDDVYFSKSNTLNIPVRAPGSSGKGGAMIGHGHTKKSHLTQHVVLEMTSEQQINTIRRLFLCTAQKSSFQRLEK